MEIEKIDSHIEATGPEFYPAGQYPGGSLLHGFAFKLSGDAAPCVAMPIAFEKIDLSKLCDKAHQDERVLGTTTLSIHRPRTLNLL
ncbi:MAG: hypothetical protein HYU64_05880 [Armatimonadetes bacterium]|nr:hypothetical protein [Armatimonadota bacterium]